MKRIAILCAALVLAITCAAGQNDVLNQFRTFIQDHPRALDELKKDPSLLQKPEFAAAHEVVGQYLTEHPEVKAEVAKQPHFFDALKATRQGGEHRNHPEEKSSSPQ